MPLGLPPVAAASLADGPYTEVNVYRPDGSRSTISARERQQYIDELVGYIAKFTASGSFWPGDNLIDPLTDPLVLPYKSHRSKCPAHSMSPRLHPGAAHRTVCGPRTADRRLLPEYRARFMALGNTRRSATRPDTDIFLACSNTTQHDAIGRNRHAW